MGKGSNNTASQNRTLTRETEPTVVLRDGIAIRVNHESTRDYIRKSWKVLGIRCTLVALHKSHQRSAKKDSARVERCNGYPYREI